VAQPVAGRLFSAAWRKGGKEEKRKKKKRGEGEGSLAKRFRTISVLILPLLNFIE